LRKKMKRGSGRFQDREVKKSPAKKTVNDALVEMTRLNRGKLLRKET